MKRAQSSQQIPLRQQSQGKIVAIKPFKNENQRFLEALKAKTIDEESTLKGIPYLLSIPGEELFVENRDDIQRKISGRKKKLSPQARIKYIKAMIKKSRIPDKPQFTNMNIALFGNGDGHPDSKDFSEGMSGINMHDNASTNKLSFSDLKISGFEESLLTTLREDGTIDPNLDDINHELNKILISIGFKGIKDYRSSSIWRNQSKKKINPLFIRTKDRQKLKFLKMKFLEKQKRLRDKPIASEERETEEQKEFLKTVQRLVDKSPRNTRRNVNRKHLFTPESAMSALPSL